MTQEDLYHQARADKNLNRLRKRSREVNIDPLEFPTKRTVIKTDQGIQDEYGNVINARIDYKGNLMDAIEGRFYYDL